MAVFERSLEVYSTELSALLAPTWSRPDQPNVVIVELDAASAQHSPGHLSAELAAVVIGVDRSGGDARPPSTLPVDLVVHDDSEQLDAIVSRVHAQPTAATSLVQLLRQSEHRSLDDALLLESAVYSTLQSGREFAAWREQRPRRPVSSQLTPAVLVERDDGRLRILLNRPHVHNALDRTMRDALLQALELVLLDHSIEQVHIAGVGPSFCAGGDLDEFGSFSDPATAHLIRTTASIGRLLMRVARRAVVHLHGACFGSGIELPAFVDDIRATEVRIALPEVSMGLIPGAGGTWSLPRRIGRHRTAWLALSGQTIDGPTARSWGLVGPEHR